MLPISHLKTAASQLKLRRQMRAFPHFQRFVSTPSYPGYAVSELSAGSGKEYEGARLQDDIGTFWVFWKLSGMWV